MCVHVACWRLHSHSHTPSLTHMHTKIKPLTQQLTIPEAFFSLHSPLHPNPTPHLPHLDEAAGSWGGSSALSLPLAGDGATSTGSGPGAQPEWVDCVQASDMCNQNPHCSSRYRVMRQCLVGKEKDSMLDTNRECQAALEVLLVSPLYDCRCKRGMKRELQCLQSYWSIHMGLTEGRRQMVL